MPQYDKLLAHINGGLAPLAEARVSVFDSALMFGDMVFEMTRSFQRQPFRLDRHLDRLRDHKDPVISSRDFRKSLGL